MESSLGMGYFGGKPPPAVTEVPTPCCLQGWDDLPIPDPSVPKTRPYELFGSLKAKQRFCGKQHGSILLTISDFWVLFIPLRICRFRKPGRCGSVAATPQISPPCSASTGPALAQGTATTGTSPLSHPVSRQPLSRAQPQPHRDGRVLQPGDTSEPHCLQERYESGQDRQRPSLYSHRVKGHNMYSAL